MFFSFWLCLFVVKYISNYTSVMIIERKGPRFVFAETSLCTLVMHCFLEKLFTLRGIYTVRKVQFVSSDTPRYSLASLDMVSASRSMPVSPNPDCVRLWKNTTALFSDSTREI